MEAVSVHSTYYVDPAARGLSAKWGNPLSLASCPLFMWEAALKNGHREEQENWINGRVMGYSYSEKPDPTQPSLRVPWEHARTREREVLFSVLYPFSLVQKMPQPPLVGRILLEVSSKFTIETYYYYYYYYYFLLLYCIYCVSYFSEHIFF